MANHRTDVPWGQILRIIVVQPGPLAREHVSYHEFDYQNVYRSMYDWTDVVHVGTLHIDYSEPVHFDTCGGKMHMKHFVKKDPLEHMHLPATAAQPHFTCANPKCKMRVQTNEPMSLSEFSDICLHLMLKQAVTYLPCGNFVDCSQDSSIVLGPEQRSVIQQLGVVSFAMCLEGYVNNTVYNPKKAIRYGLGFMLFSGALDTEACVSAQHIWLRYLVFQKFESLKEFANESTARLFGPKPNR